MRSSSLRPATTAAAASVGISDPYSVQFEMPYLNFKDVNFKPINSVISKNFMNSMMFTFPYTKCIGFSSEQEVYSECVILVDG